MKLKSLFSIALVLGLCSCNADKSSDTSQSNTEISENKNLEIGADSLKAKIDTKTNIKRLQFSIDIKADKAKIWKALWEDHYYRDWSSVFYEGSHYLVDSWQEGSKIMFLAPDSSGIYSIIESYVPNEIVKFKHIGNVIGGEALPLDDEARKWSGATEVYSLKEGPDFVRLLVEIDVLDEHVEFMSSLFPEALEKIKNNASQQGL